MPAAVAKAILLSVGIIAALGLAVMENPQIRAWLEEQRRKLAELLRSIGEELDPQTRREAEAFAYEGRTPANDEGLRREATGSADAAAMATGMSMSSASTIRRIPVRGPTDPDEAEERRRKGREYLAKRIEHLYELQTRNQASKAVDSASPPSPTSFDALVDEDGHLKTPTADPESIPAHIQRDMQEVERSLASAEQMSSSSQRAWQLGSDLANPFGDEYALERSITPKPPVPPKVELDRATTPEISVPAQISPIERIPSPDISVPGSFDAPLNRSQTAQQEESHNDELSFEEQMAIAMSLSEQESANSATVRQRQQAENEDDLEAAIAASLKDMDGQQAAHAIAHADSSTSPFKGLGQSPLVDLSTSVQPAINAAFAGWQSLFDHRAAPAREASVAPSEESDELYRLTPQLTRARLATHNAQQAAPPTTAAMSVQPVQDVMDSSFYSAPSEVVPPSDDGSRTLDHETPQLIDLEEQAPQEGMCTPTTRAISSTDTESFASLATPATRERSRPRSEVSSSVELVGVVEDSDVDMLSEEGDGIMTPDSWSEVGSQVAESEVENDTQRVAA